MLEYSDTIPVLKNFDACVLRKAKLHEVLSSSGEFADGVPFHECKNDVFLTFVSDTFKKMYVFFLLVL